MPRRCSICTHSCHRAIDEAMIAGEPFRRIASHFEISEAAVRRHRAHVGAKITKAAQIRESAEGATLLDRLEALQTRTLEILSREGGNDRITLAAIREARENLKLIGEMTGKLRGGATVNVAWFRPRRKCSRRKTRRPLASGSSPSWRASQPAALRTQ